MTVSLIVGRLNILAEQTESAAAILQGLHRLLLPNGKGVLANAGHLPPCRNGEEIEMISNLPLGVSLERLYE